MATWLAVLSVLGIYLARMVELRAKRDTLPGRVQETRTLRWFVLTGTLMLAGALGEFWWRRPEWNSTTFALGWACGLASFGLRRSAIAALGKFWSLHVEIRETHEFVRGGPFRWMRHPTYCSMILELLAAAFILQAPPHAGGGRPAFCRRVGRARAAGGDGAGGEVRRGLPRVSTEHPGGDSVEGTGGNDQ